MKPGDTLTVTDRDVAFRCPFCGRQVQTVSGGACAVLHADPPCARFVALDVTDYLHAVNVALGHLPA